MSLRITNSVTDVSLINRWAEDIERRLHATNQIATAALVAVNPPPGTSPTLSVTFDKVKSGDNVQATMTVDSGASLAYTGNGVVNANKIGGIQVANNTPTHTGQLLISQPGNTTAVWADPLVQGLNPPGGSASGLNPVLVGAVDPAGLLQDLTEDGRGNLNVAVQNEPGVRIEDTTGEPLLATNTALNVHIFNQEVPITIADSNSNPLVSTSGALNVFTTNPATSSGNAAAGLTGSPVPTSSDHIGFNSSGNLIDVSAANPLPVSDTLVETNTASMAAAEAIIAANTQNNILILNVLNSILAQLKLLNLNLASSMPSAYVDNDTYIMDSIPTLQ